MIRRADVVTVRSTVRSNLPSLRALGGGDWRYAVLDAKFDKAGEELVIVAKADFEELLARSEAQVTVRKVRYWPAILLATLSALAMVAVSVFLAARAAR